MWIGKMADSDRALFWFFICGFLLQLTLCRCPAKCVCLGAIVDCTNQGLSEVPQDLPEWTERLDLSGNKKLKLTEGAFNNLPLLSKLYLGELSINHLPALGSLPSLKYLNLSGNKFSSVDRLTLTGMPQLRELDLSRNRLETITPDSFANVTLFRLNLSKNKIVSLNSESFKNLKSLAELRLSRNQLRSSTFDRSANVFSNLTNLVSLDLNGNQIHSLPGLMFEHLKRLKTLRLRRNEIANFSDGAFYGLESMQNLVLDYNNITTVKHGWLFGLESLQHLSISHNQIDSIRPLSWDSKENLQTLDLSHNRLVSLREGTFKNLKKLTKLSLSHNYLGYIEQNTFEVTPNLKDLDLSNNELRWSIEDNSGAFNTLMSLQALSLAYNDIETVHNETFVPLVSLAALDLRGNQLRTLPNNLFTGLKYLTTVYMNTSSLICDCHISWLPKWLSGINLNNSNIRAVCSYPLNLKDQPVASIPADDLNCDSSLRPIIREFPKDHLALKGENVILVCVAQASTEGGQLTFFWRKDNELLVHLQNEILANIVGPDGRNGAVHNVKSLLHLNNVTDEDNGDYQCIVRNNFGPDFSERASLEVNVFPYFIKTPVDVEVQVGGVAKLECAIGGSPAPELSWHKDGAEDYFPAARERRFHVHSNSNVYYIKPVQPIDQGQYTCNATSKVGTALANVSITVRQTPKIVKPLMDRVARLGDFAVLECQGTGQPAPKITWRKDGVLLEGDRYLMVQDSQYLMILETQMDDAGIYICELTNILGTVREPVNLSIRRDINTTSTTTGIVMMTIVVCVVITSLVWVVIIYHTRKRTSSEDLNSSGGYPEDGIDRYPSHLSAHHHHHLPSDLVHTFTPLLNNSTEYTTAAQDSGSEHSNGKDSGTGDSAQRSSEDLLPIDLTRSGLRRSLIICADSGSSILRGIGPNGEIIGCDDSLNRPRLSTFSTQHGSYSPSHYATTLRCGSNSRLIPVSTPITPSATLPRSRPSLHRNLSHRKPSQNIDNSKEYCPQKVPVPVHLNRANDDDDDLDMCEKYDSSLEHSSEDNYVINHGVMLDDSVSHSNPRYSMYSSDGDQRSELDLRTENHENISNKSNIPIKNNLESR